MPDPAARIRRATVRDFEAVSALLAELGRPVVTPDARGALQGVYERHLARPEVSSLVAEIDQKVVGYLSLEFRERLNHATLEAWIPDLIVTEASRGRGVGRGLLEAAFREARDRKAHRVSADAGNHREAAQRAYVAAGMVDTGRYFVKSPP